MKNQIRLIAAVSLLAAAGCAQSMDRPAAESSYRAFKRIAGATATGVNKPSYDALRQDAATELLVLADLAPSTGDTAVLRHYAAALVKYKDAGALWANQISDARYDWIPAGRIYFTDRALVARYKLSTESHKMPYTGTPYETVSSESIQTIWALAKADCDSADQRVVAKLSKMYR